MGLERVSGVVSFEVTDLDKVSVKDYANTRDFSEVIKGDVALECIVLVKVDDVVNGKDLVVVSNEVSGKIAIYQIDKGTKTYNIVANHTK